MSPIQLAKSKTMVFSAALAALSVAQGFVVKMPVEPMEQMYIGMAIAAAIAVLRLVTTQPVSAK